MMEVGVPAVETSRAKILSRLTKDGWELVRHGASHDIYQHPTTLNVITIPRHRNLQPGTARSISKAAGWH